MSWTENFHNVRADDKLEPQNKATSEVVNKDNELQFEAACRAARELMTSASMGNYHDEEALFNITMNGHENKDHNPLTGWSFDQIHVSVSRVKVPSKADQAANQSTVDLYG